jgi:uncharacterized protein YbjQ (UPF0145 family)
MSWSEKFLPSTIAQSRITRMLGVVPVIAVIGAQWGDEGKGKVVDLLAQEARWWSVFLVVIMLGIL